MIHSVGTSDRNLSELASAARFLLYCLILWAPLPLGSNRPIAWVANGAISVLVLVLFLIGEAGRERRHIDWRPAATAGLAFLAVMVWMVVQALPGVPAAIRHPIWSSLMGDLDARWAAISINPSSTWTTVVQVAPVGFLSIVAMRLAFDPQRANRLLKVVLLATCAVAIYGLIAQYAGIRQTFLLDNDAYPGFLTGTFVGRNGASAYFIIGMAVATSLIAARLEGILSVKIRRGHSWFLHLAELVRRTGVLLVADFVLMAALLDTGSRGGFIAGGFVLLTIVLVSIYRAGTERRRAATVFTGVLGALFIVAGVSSDLLLGRLQSEVGDEHRLDTYRDTLDMIAARPLLGHGAGTFADAFPLFHSLTSSVRVWTHAHNSYLQAAAELGLPAFVVLSAGILLVVVTLVRNVGRRDESQPAATASLAVLAGIGFYSIVDFSLQIQAIGLTVAVIVGAGLGETMACKARSAHRSSRDGSGVDRLFKERETVRVTIPARSASIETSSAS